MDADMFYLSDLITQGKNYRDNGNWDLTKTEHEDLRNDLVLAIEFAHDVRTGKDVEQETITLFEGSLRKAIEAVIKAGITDAPVPAMPSEEGATSGLHTGVDTGYTSAYPSRSHWKDVETKQERRLWKLMRYHSADLGGDAFDLL